MEVVIDGVKYVPESDAFRVVAHGIEYENIPHWLLNVESRLVNEWVNSLREGEIPSNNPEAEAKRKKVMEFRDFCEKFLGYKWDNKDYVFNEIEEEKL